MKVITLNKPGEWKSSEAPIPTKNLGKDEVLVKVKKIGVCGTDLHAFKGSQPFFSYPRILGHELAVEVVEIGNEVKNVAIGDLCCVEPYYNDIEGQAVRRGKTNCGEHLKVLGVHVDGGMQEYFTYPSKFLHKSATLSPDQLVLIEPLAIGYHAVDRAQITANDIVLVIGAGPIGLSVALFAKLSNARVIAMDVDENKLKKCKAITGITDTLMATENTLADLTTLLNGDLPTIIIDATGNSASMMNTFNLVAAGGTIVFVGLFLGDVTFNDPNFHKKELTLKASRAAMSEDFDKIIKLMETGKIDTQLFITHRINFDQVTSEFEKLYAYGGDLVKAVIDLN
ncbi:zinc-binding alcohol dehydrogenase family protein [Pedobacter changchengzhani]|uniref:Zinc-binding alcohol dehydrogenase family protein n=1 Tax=Pedobacter changchengzhani TaxID=2529274 RepID=A0A4R5MLB3_9SPHI|nr:zinc-binding alcohol dehydrogenase family protein [Pedobacter changchengzhani]TDG36246.1 zinc-binding alcohol dehydrogenase family protein [Pedobacter changchengzhani]